MAAGRDGNVDFYSVLGLEKECSVSELKNAYKKLALRWHPDRCSASGNSKFVEEAKRKFQKIQEAYSVLSDPNKRFLYDIGIHENDGEEDDGMCDFMEEMAVLMSQTKANEKREESFEELQELFNEMFQRDIFPYEQSSSSTSSFSSSSSSINSSKMYSNNNINNGPKRNCSSSTRSGKAKDKVSFESRPYFLDRQEGQEREKARRSGGEVEKSLGSSTAEFGLWSGVRGRERTTSLRCFLRKTSAPLLLVVSLYCSIIEY